MLNARKKTAVAALLLMFLSTQVVHAEVKLYQYDGKLPFVQMMLNMMVAMGILDRLPSNSRYGGYPSSSWGGLSNPYARALAMRGLSPGSAFGSQYGNNPFASSPWLQQSPWSSPAVSGADWGSPNWGVLPTESYARSPYGYGAYDSLPANAYWSRNDLAGWVNEPWETSAWNSKAEKSETDKSSQSQTSPPVPLVQNFNYNAPAPLDETSNNRTANNRSNKSSPLAKLAPSARPPARGNVEPQYRQSPLSKRMEPPTNTPKRNKSRKMIQQKPCITEFCGLKKPNLDGLWVAQDGEMLGIKNNRYLWSDSSSRYLTGKIKIQNEYLLANVDGHDRLMRFKYKLAGNHLLTMQPDGKIREFTRMRADQYSNYAQGGRGDYRQSYY